MVTVVKSTTHGTTPTTLPIGIVGITLIVVTMTTTRTIATVRTCAITPTLARSGGPRPATLAGRLACVTCYHITCYVRCASVWSMNGHTSCEVQSMYHQGIIEDVSIVMIEVPVQVEPVVQVGGEGSNLPDVPVVPDSRAPMPYALRPANFQFGPTRRSPEDARAALAAAGCRRPSSRSAMFKARRCSAAMLKDWSACAAEVRSRGVRGPCTRRPVQGTLRAKSPAHPRMCWAFDQTGSYKRWNSESAHG
jgi:hypothetical protein